jgi:hypothetical protein
MTAATRGSADERNYVMLAAPSRAAARTDGVFCHPMSSSFGAYQACDRIVIVPRMRDARGFKLDDTEALIAFAADSAPYDLGVAAIGALGHERQVDYAMDFRSENYRYGMPPTASASAQLLA